MSISQLWAKADGEAWHPLTHHMLDSAFVAAELWERLVSRRMRERLGEPTASTIRLLAGLHDVGKASPAFQGKIPELAPADAPRSTRPEYSHGIVTGHHLRTSKAFAEAYGVSSQQLAQSLAGHHGIVPSMAQLRAAGRSTARTHVGAGHWSTWREELTQWLSDILGNPHAPVLWYDKPIEVPAVAYLLGLVSVADWIASNVRWFPYSTESAKAYVDVARQRAGNAITALGFDRWKPLAQGPEERMGVARLHPTQETTATLVRSQRSPGLVIVESETGSGKTETALDIAGELVVKGMASGLYFAMPTRATSNALYDRMREFLERSSDQADVGLQLIHGRASLHGEFAESIGARPLVPKGVWDRDRSGTSVVAESWFFYRRRGVLCPIGVGVVDEILLSAQQARYGYVRLYGLADKVIIVDEVHAYDDYMMVLLEVALEWFGQRGTPVVLLSATLPQRTRRRLLGAYGCEIPDDLASAYPMVSVGSRGAIAEAIPTGPTAERVITVQWLPGDVDGIAVGVSAAVALSESADVLLLRNTVARAQASARRIRDLRPDVEVRLLHSRIPFARRDKLERELLGHFGPGGERPKGSVTVATQVVEQSLDVDFDVLITDFAPTDLLLQRAGRVHRHRDHPEPRIVVTGYELAGDSVTFDTGSAFIYGEYRLVRTRRALQGRTVIAVPADVVEVMEATYSEPPTDDDLASLRQEDEKRRHEDQAEADRRRLPHPPIAYLEQINEHWGKDNENAAPKHRALSRLGESVDVIVVDDANRDADPATVQGQRLLMESSLSLGSPRGLVASLRATDRHEWEHTRLKFFRRLELDNKGYAEIEGAGRTYRVQLDDFLGLIVEEKH
ncbi:MAG: CRISPR-associated helicase Cas3' [Gammaproteobacteria bacterium]|nr:CRISPR-associated helicase Cas3' [Gammaproteobacteria bacterium]